MTTAEQGSSVRAGSGQIRVAFVMTAPTIWPSVRSVWEACVADPRFSPRLILAPSVFPDRQTRDFTQARAFLIDQGLPFTYGHSGILNDLKPDVAFVPLPYMEMMPPGLQLADFERNGVRIAYVPYGLEMGGGAFNMQYQFNLPLHNHAWRIFARSESHRRMFGRYCASGSGHVAVTGAPRLDRLARLDDIDAGEFEAQIGGRTAILWAPHFSEGGEAAWSSFGPYRDQVLDLFEALPQSHVLLFRPHPLLFANLRKNGYWTPEQEKAFRDRIVSAGNIILDERADYLPAFKAANAIMADAGSFLLEFFATGKPVLYMAPEGGYGLNDDGDLVDHLYVCRGPGDLTAFVKAMGRGEDPMEDARRAARPAYLHIPEEGTIGQAIADHVADAVLARDDARVSQGGEDPIQVEARAFWMGANTPNIRSKAYYDTKELIFRALVEAHGPYATAADIGCGDGRFTRVLAEHAGKVTACDMNALFIEEARAQAVAHGVANIDWRVEALDHVRTLGRYDLVSCCDVLSAVINPRDFVLATSLLHAMVKRGGLLLVEDTLVAGAMVQARDPKAGYVAVYRNARDYADAFAYAGFELVAQHPVHTHAQGVESSLFLFKRAGD